MTRGGLFALAAAAGLIVGFALAAPAPPAEAPPATPFDAPDVPPSLRAPSPDRAALERQCLICHGLPIIVGQRLTEAQWAATVKKMRDTFHAPLGEDDEARIVALLARALPPELPAAEPARQWPPVGPEAVPTFAEVSGPFDQAEATLGAERFAAACAACHGPDALGGANAPRLVGRAILADSIAFQLLLIHGRGAMPPLPDADSRAARELLAYLRARTAKRS